MPKLRFVEKNEDAAKDLDKLGRLPDGEYEEWFGGWDVYPGLDSLKRAPTRNQNCVYARFDGAPKEVTVTDGATIGFGGSEDPHNPNWQTHQETVSSDKSGIWEGDTVSFTVRHNGKSVKLKGKVIKKEYSGKWDKGGESSWGRPTCSFTIRLTPKTIENAIAKLEGTDGKSEAVLNRVTMKEVRKVLDKLQKDGQFNKALHEVTALCTYAGNHIANTDPDVTDNKLNAPERKIVTRAVLAHIAAQFGYQPEDLR